MIDGRYGVYKGEVHRIGIDEKDQIYLYPNSESEIDDTYIDRYILGKYSKPVDSSELTEMYKLSSFAEYKGYKVGVLPVKSEMSMNHGLVIVKLPKSLDLTDAINIHII
ncbi:hypothetical protein [Ruminococcus albus]|uniref:hypothetical protein n=1 Tax=Ruminococcus albus TaxID=1264 RepID=UPI0009424D4D|nr:hypothetical protein [Ruminococcus albus]